MDRTDPIRLSHHQRPLAVGMNPGEARRHMFISVWLVVLLCCATVTVLATRPLQGTRGHDHAGDIPVMAANAASSGSWASRGPGSVTH